MLASHTPLLLLQACSAVIFFLVHASLLQKALSVKFPQRGPL